MIWPVHIMELRYPTGFLQENKRWLLSGESDESWFSGEGVKLLYAMNNVAKLNLKKKKRKERNFIDTHSLSIIPPHGPPTCTQRKSFFTLTQTALSRCICSLQYSSLKTVHQIWSMTSCFIFVWTFFKNKNKKSLTHTQKKKTLNKQIEKNKSAAWLSDCLCRPVRILHCNSLRRLKDVCGHSAQTGIF